MAKQIECGCCGARGPHGGRGLIRSCHMRHQRNETLHRFPIRTATPQSDPVGVFVRMEQRQRDELQHYARIRNRSVNRLINDMLVAAGIITQED